MIMEAFYYEESNMYDELDFIIKKYVCKKTGKKKPQRWVMHYCDKCNKRRSYAPRNRRALCMTCSSKGKTISKQHRKNISETLLKNKNYLGHTIKSRMQAAINANKTKMAWSKKKRRNIAYKGAATRMGLSLEDFKQLRFKIKIRRAVAHNMRSQIWQILKGINGQLRHVDWTADDLIKHLENQFQPGMSWDNYGRKVGIRCWEIDHIIPINAKNANNEYIFKNLHDPKSDDFKKCMALENLQPLWALDNNRKNNKV